MILRVSDLPVVEKDELSNLDNDGTLFEVSTRGDSLDNWKSMALRYGDLKTETVLCVAHQDFNFEGDKVFNNNVSISGDLSLSGNVIIKGENPEQNTLCIETRSNTLISHEDNTISAKENNYFYGQSNRFFGDVLFYELSDENATQSLMSISHGVLSTGNDIYCGEMHGLASSARWGDVAELYVSDEDYEPGTLVQFGGEKEITVATAISDTGVNGVITTRPGMTINSALKDTNEEHILGVALVGRVPVKVVGKIKKFDNIKLSDIDGVGIVSDNKSDTIIGKALASKDTDGIGLAECVVRLTF